ncbi:MAG: Gfo/Idh/MocA family oxidoreductase [Melioribacteraceae bacterium]
MRIVVIGAGIAALQHIPEILFNKEFQLVALCSQSIEKCKYTASYFGINHAYDSVEKMFTEHSVDGCLIAVPPKFVYSIFAKAASYVNNFIIEKPFLETLGTISNVEINLLNSKKIVIIYPRRYKLGWVHTKKWIEENKIGEIKTINCIWKGPYYERFSIRGKTYLSQPHLRSRGVLLDSGSHIIDYIHYISGEVFYPKIQKLVFDKNIRVEYEGFIKLKSCSGICARLLICNSDVLKHETRTVSIIGTKGKIFIDDIASHLYSNHEIKEIIRHDYIHSPVNDLLLMYKNKEEKILGANLNDGMKVIECIDQIYNLNNLNK